MPRPGAIGQPRPQHIQRHRGMRLGGNATAWTDVAIAALPFKAITIRPDQSSLGTGGA